MDAPFAAHEIRQSKKASMTDFFRGWRNAAPISRWNYSLGIFLILGAVEQLRDGTDPLFAVIFAVVAVPAGTVITMRRLFDLRRSLWWMVPIAIPVLAGFIAAFKGTELQLRLALGVAFVALALLFFVPKSSGPSSEAVQPSGQNPS
jgi:uncharacterized membrane protein YhaH (DUF805 family)